MKSGTACAIVVVLNCFARASVPAGNFQLRDLPQSTPWLSIPTRTPSCTCPTRIKDAQSDGRHSNDALRKHGILPPKVEAPPSPSPPPSPTLASVLHSSRPEDIDELDDLAADSDEERMIDSFRRQRLAEIAKEGKASRRFGEVIPISREDYTREVTEASRAPEPDEDEKNPDDSFPRTGVVCFLYQDGCVPASEHVEAIKQTLIGILLFYTESLPAYGSLVSCGPSRQSILGRNLFQS